MKQPVRAAHYLGIVALLIAIAALLGYYYLLTPFASIETTQYLYIDDDDTADSVYAKLAPVASRHGMTALHTLTAHSSYHEHPLTGRYAVTPGQSTLRLFRSLRNGQQAPIRLTIPESRTMDRLAAQLATKLMLDSATIAEALCTNEFCSQYGYDTLTIPCLFVPNTYEVYWNISLEKLMQRMEREHDAFWTAERTAKAQSAGLTPVEVCTLASIIDEETAAVAEKPLVAGMYINRLRCGMPLQADPTVKFALKAFSARRIYRNMLTADSPFNTYRNPGLPPGPIKIASVQGIDAVLGYAHHDYLYMCANEDFSGTHRFAVTYSEHLKNAARYAKALNERGIK